ncbi:MAG: NUDIX hydrolase N-terminal domain-containing protein [Caldilineaceae bacterium]|nr:NUDIX hydrolase N-terminal domain-containing protein [Caldilineaceae bacterium]
MSVNPSETTSEGTAGRLVQIADQIRAMANNGLFYGKDPYDIDRYQRLLRLAAELLSMAATQSLEEIKRVFLTDVDLRTPLTGMDTAVFDEAGRILLIRRADNHKWAMPGGAAEVGDTPAENAAREVWEETGYQVEITHLLGIFDKTRYRRNSRRHLYLLLFAGTIIGGEATVSNETLDVQWFALDAIPWDDLSPGHPVRLRHAMKWYGDPTTPAYFDLLSSRPFEQESAHSD